MAGREAARAPVGQAQDPLLRISQAESSGEALVTGGESLRAGSFKTLARKGLWKEVAQQTANYRQAGPDSILEKAAWHIMSLAKLRNLSAAAEELESLGSLDSPEFLLDSAQGTQSRVPFALRLLACEIPSRQGNWRESQDAFYALLECCKQKAEERLPTPDAGLQQAHRALWRGREERIVGSIFCQHLRLRDYRTALQWLAWLRQRHPDNLELLSTIGCLQLIIGHIPAAAATFQAISALVSENPGTEENQQRLVRCNRGLLLFAQNDFEAAAAEFDAIVEEAPEDYVAANNRAVCRTYAGDLKAAVQSLEGSLRDQPLAMLHEAVISNLASMYELSSPLTSQAAKKNLGAWAVRLSPDDFDLSCLR